MDSIPIQVVAHVARNLGTEKSTMSTATATSTAQASATSASSGGGSGPTSSPLLFFVALGFGVVFTNLWYVSGDDGSGEIADGLGRCSRRDC
jgi:uncharacterized protein HemX